MFSQAMGAAPPSFTSLNLASIAEHTGVNHEAQQEVIKATAASIYGAGADTTVSSLGTFILGMLANPEAQRKAQVEIDKVLGHGRLPEFTDEASLPYVSAFVKEVLRWKNVTPIGAPYISLRCWAHSFLNISQLSHTISQLLAMMNTAGIESREARLSLEMRGM